MITDGDLLMNILVVDDEPLIHISIEKLISTCSGETSVFHAYNGRQMLDCLSERNFALAYVDIKMPGISGLEALRQAKDISPFTSYYIMTGFDEFEYAKQAVKLKVDDYLMKPLDIKTIRETVQEAKVQLQHNLEHKKNVFRNWLESTLNQRESSFNEYAGCYCGLVLVTADAPDISSEVIQGIFQRYDDYMVSMSTKDGLLLLTFSEKFDFVHKMFKDISSLPYPDGVTCITSSITRESGELKAILPALTQFSHVRVLLGTGHFYYLNPLQDYSPSLLEFCHSCIDWQNAYLSRDYTAFSSQSELISSQFRNHSELQKYSGQFEAFLALTLGRPLDLLSDINSLKDILGQAAKELLSAPAMDSKVQTIVHFIQKHYQENISAAELSARFGLSANYISNLLKSALGIRYNDYVTQLRLNHAKKLLISTHQSVKEITSVCGYYSQSHFTKLFLEHVGCTPSEYRKKEGENIDVERRERGGGAKGRADPPAGESPGSFSHPL